VSWPPRLWQTGRKPSVIGVTYKQGSSSIDGVIAIPAHLYFAAQHANFGLDVAVLYVSIEGTSETVESGRVSIKFDTTMLDFDDDTIAVLLKVPLGNLPVPGDAPNFTSTLELLAPGQK
jgi:hypothetical protein